MDDGTVVNTSNASNSWEEDTTWNGNNYISVATREFGNHETLYMSRKERYYLEHKSQFQRRLPWAEWISNQRAAAWLLANNHEVPEDLLAAADEVSE